MDLADVENRDGQEEPSSERNDTSLDGLINEFCETSCRERKRMCVYLMSGKREECPAFAMGVFAETIVETCGKNLEEKCQISQPNMREAIEEAEKRMKELVSSRSNPLLRFIVE